MAYIELVDYDTTYLALRVSGLDSGYAREDRYIEWYFDGNYHSSGSLSAQVDSSSTCYIIGLSPGTTYSITAIIYYSSTPTSGVDSSKSLSGSFTTAEEYVTPRPNYFDWDTDKVSGGDFNLTASEWNRLCANINDVREYLGYRRMNFTTVYSGDIFTADIYNEAVTALTSISEFSGNLSYAATGNTVYASMLQWLQDAINSL